MKISFKFLLIFASIFVFTNSSYASQTYFSKQYRGANMTFAYKWKDVYGAHQNLNFTLPISDMERGEREFKPYNNREANSYVYKKMVEYARKRSRVTGIDLKLSSVNGGFKISARGGRSQRVVNDEVEHIKNMQSQLMKEYVESKWYTFMNDETIMPDHKRIAKRYIRAMSPVAKAMAPAIKHKRRRDKVNYVLSFLQNIPYDTLQSRYTSNGAGFQTPYGVLSGNRGDCDSKSVAFASIMRNFYPQAKIVIVYVPGHALVGFNFPQGAKDQAIRINGVGYVLAEPVGPALAKFGQISPESKAYLKQGDYSYQEVLF